MSEIQKIQLPSDANHTGRDLGAAEIQLLTEAIQTGHLTSTAGTFVPRLEKAFAEAFGVQRAIACANGSAAVHTAVAAINPSPGDEIITTAVTDMGAITAILYQGAIPVFCDIDPKTYNVTAETIAKKISKHTKAIIVTHIFGNACDMDPIMALAKQHNLPVIEDCAQAYLATYKGRLLGTIGDIGCFSFQQGKHMTTGEGGIVVSNNADYAQRMFYFVNKAWGYGDGPKADHYFLAPNYRLSELQGAVACAQLAKLEGCVNRRRAAAAKMDALLADLTVAEAPKVTPDSVHVYWKYALHMHEDRLGADMNEFAAYIRERGVNCAPRYVVKPAFECQVIRDRVTFGNSHWPWEGAHMAGRDPVTYPKGDYPGTYYGLAHVFVLPWSEFYTDEHLQQISAILHEAEAHFLKKANAHVS